MVTEFLMEKQSSPRAEHYAALLIAALMVVILIAQARLLYVFPQPDGARWWGDETGQMLELRTELQQGYASIPTALGSSVAITNGLVRGNSWAAAAMYGVPALLFSKVADVVAIGRTITFALSIVLLFVMYRMMRASRVPRVLALFALLLLATTRSFFFASHAARLDVAAAIGVLAFVWYLSGRDEAFKQVKWKPSALWYFVYGVSVILFATLSIHLLTLLGMLSLYMFWRFGTFRKPSAMISVISGIAAMLGLLVAIYAISGAPFSLYSPSSAPNQFQSVAAELPILRPFSRSVQVANILERIHGLWSEAPAFLILVIVAIVLYCIRRFSAQKSNDAGWISGAAIVIAIAWLLFQSPALYYYIQVLPIFIVALVIGISKRWKPGIVSFSIVGIIAVMLCGFGTMDSMRAERTARAIKRGSHRALVEAIDLIRADDNSGAPPIVLAQNPAIAMLEHDKSIRLMTAHVVSFPTSSEPIADVLQRLHVKYILLYAAHDGSDYSADYHALRPIADSLGTLDFSKPGSLFDVHRDYFTPDTLREDRSFDTLILYKLTSIAR
jgi:hypothetical protein